MPAGLAKYSPPRYVKQFSDLLGVTISTSNATVVSSIDLTSPFGCPALKLVITFSTTAGRVEITPPATNIPSFAGHLGYTVWIDDPTKVGQASVFIGTGSFALYQQSNYPIFSAGDVTAGPRAVYAGPLRQSNITDGGFVFGTSSLVAHKLRFSSSNPIVDTATVWVKDCFIVYPQRPTVVFSFDDGYASWVSTVLPALSGIGVKGTFGINSANIDAGGGITTADVQAIIAAGHHLSSHNVNNNKMQVLFGQGNGESNGTGTPQLATSYVADYHTARAVIESAGANPQDFCYHPWMTQVSRRFSMPESKWRAARRLMKRKPMGCRNTGQP